MGEAAVRQALELLDQDISMHSGRLRPMPLDLYRRLIAVTDGVERGDDEPIEGKVAL